MQLLNHLRRVAIVGLPNSGKTVLLTSLLMHLKNLSPVLADGVGPLTSFRPRHVKGTIGQSLPEFPYDLYRRHLAEHGVFPGKTVTESEYSFDLEVDGRPYQVDVLDVPGERFYDLEMFGHDYSAWCDQLEKLWDREPHPAMSLYSQTFESNESPNAESVVTAYRYLLAQLISDYRTSISPSTFRLSRSGDSARGRTGSAILESVARNPCGLSLETQFAPMFRQSREKHKELTKQFIAHYDAYRKALVEPLFSELALCDRLIFLIDIPHLLAAGTGAFEDQDHLIERALDALIPKPGVGVSIGRFLRNRVLDVVSLGSLFSESFQWFRPGLVQRVAFVATKSDLVAVSDIDRLAGLLSSLVAPKKSYLHGIEAEQIVLSAVKSTENPGIKDTDEVGHLTGRLQYDYSMTPPTRRSPSDAKVDYDVSRLPEEWQQSWGANSYSFPLVYPDIPKLKIVCPKQENLNKLFKFIIHN